MHDIKIREVTKGTIKTLDKSISSSHRIRNAASEIKEAGKAGIHTPEQSPNEYAADRFQGGTQRSIFLAERGAEKAGEKSAGAIQNAMRNRHAKAEAKKTIKNKAVIANIRQRKNVQTVRDAAKASQRSMHIMRGVSKGTGRTSVHTVKTGAKSVRHIAGTLIKSTKALIGATKALITAIAAAGWIAVVVIVICCLFGAAFYFFGDESSSNYIPVSKEVEAYSPLIMEYANKYGIGEYVDLIKAVMMQESGGKGTDPMQASESPFNKKYSKAPNSIKDPAYSIECGVQALKSAINEAKVASPVDMDRISLALQGYNYGNGYISWALKTNGGYTAANAAEFSAMMAKKMGRSSYGDKEYVSHVLRYYPYGNYSYDVVYNGPGKLGLPIKGMTRSNISSHFGPRSSPGGIGSSNHQGLDIAFPTGTHILACESGTVVLAGWNGGLGKCVIISHGKGLQTVYGHQSSLNVKSGQRVVRGQYIGNVGSTGQSTGPHLHLGVMLNGKYVNPEKGWLSIL